MSRACLLDSHIWIWAAAGVPRRLGPRTRKRLERGAGAGRIYVCTISAFEIAALHTAGRLKLNQPADRWVAESVERGGLRVLDISTRVAVDAGAIPASSLPDPADRLLVATTRHHDLELITRDEAILSYARATGLVRVWDGGR